MTQTAAFAHRAAPHTLPEWMDTPASLETLRGCLGSLRQINVLTGSYRPTLAFLRRALHHAHAHGQHFTEQSPLRILDIGAGGGDTLVRIARWAAIRRLPVALTGADLNPQSAILARETEVRLTSRTPRLRGTPITWLTADALTLDLPHPPDLILSSLFMHHLEDAEIVRVLRWQHATATLGWFINDLARSLRAARLYLALGTVLRWHPFCLHDGPVSFRRAFRAADWHALLAQANITSATLLPTRPARLCLQHLR
jgi:SAM-dependent methyltransferase